MTQGRDMSAIDRDREIAAKATKFVEQMRRLISGETDWENGEVGVGHGFRQIVRAAFEELEAE